MAAGQIVKADPEIHFACCLVEQETTVHSSMAVETDERRKGEGSCEKLVSCSDFMGYA